MKNLIALLHARIEFLRSGGSAAPQQVAGIYTLLGNGERGTRPVTSVIVNVAAVLAGALLIEWLFVLYAAAARRRITSSAPAGLIAKIGALASQALLDFAAIAIFIVSALVFFFRFTRSNCRRARSSGRLPGRLGFFQGAYLVLRFFLAPRASNLRFLPFSDQTALYLHHWLMSLTFVICIGTVTTGVIRLAGAIELTVIKSWMVGAFIAAGMIIWMILQKTQSSSHCIQPRSAGIQPALPTGAKVAALCRLCCFTVVGCQYRQHDSGNCLETGDPDLVDGTALLSAGLDLADA